MTSSGDMSCQQLVELVSAYFDGALSADERDRLEAHLRDCDACVDHVVQMRMTIRAVGASSLDDRPSVRALLGVFREWKRARSSSASSA